MKNIGYSYNGFTISRLKRFLKTGGQSFKFIAWGLNEFGEPVTETTELTILGVLHSSDALINSSPSTSAGSKIRLNNTLSIITSWESLAIGFSGGKELLPDMTIIINGVKHRVVKVENVNDWGIVAEISLEEFDGWQH